MLYTGGHICQAWKHEPIIGVWGLCRQQGSEAPDQRVKGRLKAFGFYMPNRE